MKLNRTETATAIGCTPGTLDAWVRDGCPCEARPGQGKAATFDLPAVIAWLRERAAAQAIDRAQRAADAGDLDALRARKLALSIEAAELDLAIRKREVAPVAEFERVQRHAATVIRSNILNVPARAALQLLGETDEARFREILRAELTLALQQAAAADLTPPDADEADEGDTDRAA
jgi:phage terminase Nu1 subunit (DNA packaging protein)